jgi:hypothetical protein
VLHPSALGGGSVVQLISGRTRSATYSSLAKMVS